MNKIEAGICPEFVGYKDKDSQEGLVFKSLTGTFLSGLETHDKLEIDQIVRIGIQILDALDRLHNCQILHLSIQPKNIIWDQTKGRVFLWGLENARTTQGSGANLTSFPLPVELNGWMAPEQTGNLNLKVDIRTDLYGLGATLYFLLSGYSPIREEQDPLKLVHRILASPILELPESICPSIFFKIISRLLDKSPGKRYQSVQGVRWDLEQLLEDPNLLEMNSDFVIGQHDRQNIFRLPDRLCGRDGHLKAMAEVYNRVQEGGTELLLLKGPTGIGKSFLWETFAKARRENKGYFAEGKFAEFNKDIPYQGWMEVFSFLLKDLLTEDEELLSQWRSKIELVIGENLNLFLDSVPELGLFVNQVKTETELLPVDSKSRFQLIIKEFIKLFGKPGAPLVIFLDDLQWANRPSIDLISAVLSDRSIDNLLIVAGCTMDSEIKDPDSLKALRSGISNPQQILELDLQPIVLEDVVDWLKSAFQLPPKEIEELASLALSKTLGNPFYIKSWFNSLYSAGLIEWDTTRMSWSWDANKISKANLPDDMTDLVMENVRELPDTTLEVLKHASCLGKSFTLGLLSKLTGESTDTLLHHLGAAIDLNIIQRSQDGVVGVYNERGLVDTAFKFSHDTIRSILYHNLSESNKSVSHTKAALALIDQMDTYSEERDLYAISHHLMMGESLSIPEEYRMKAMKLLILAGSRTMQTGAFQQASNFFTKTKELVCPEDWATKFKDLFQLYTRLGECLFILGDVEEANSHFEKVIESSPDTYTKAWVLYRQMGLYNFRMDIAEAHKKALEGLQLLGKAYSEGASLAIAIRKLASILVRFTLNKAEKLLNSPKRAPKEMALAIDFLIETSSFSYEKNPSYAFQPILEILNITLRHGLAEGSPYAVAALGGVHNVYLQQPDKAQKFWDVALRMLEKFPSHSQTGRVRFIVFGTMKNLLIPVKDCLSELRENYHTCIKEGDLYWAYCSIVFSCYFLLKIGQRLSDLSDFVDSHMKALFPRNAGRIKFPNVNLRMIKEYITTLQNSVPATPLSPLLFEEVVNLDNKASLLVYHYLNTSLAYYSGEIKWALESVKKTKAFLPWAHATSLQQDIILLDSVILTEAKDLGLLTDWNATMKTIRSNYRQMKGFAKKAPSNFKAKELILQGLLEYVNDRKLKATETLIQAKFTAQENSMLPDAALAAEWAGKIKFEMEKRVGAAILIQEAYSAYGRWENNQAANCLLNKYPGLIYGQVEEDGESPKSALSLATIEKTSMILASERHQKPLLAKFLSLIMEYTGASFSAYFSYEKDRLWLEAKAGLDNSYPSMEKYTALTDLSDFPQKVVRFVSRTKENLVLDNPEIDPRFTLRGISEKDPPLSLLCYPLFQGGRLQGILYAENKYFHAAFTNEKLQLLKLLSGQMSLSIENAKAHELLEAKVMERTIALDKERKRSEKLLLNILPRQVAEELKDKNKATPRYYAESSVLFTDFVDFTKHVKELSPQKLVSLLDEYFSAFDTICIKHGIEKIKTIGDAFLCVGGLPVPDQDHALKIVAVACEMISFVEKKLNEAKKNNSTAFNIRIGIHSGPLIAGVVGLQKFSFDIWGDTVNIAFRMEESSHSGKINISAETHSLVSQVFDCEYRGKIDIKGKGLTDMYFVKPLNQDVSI